MESDFIANRAHQNETEGYLIWPQLKLCSHEIVIEKNEEKRKMIYSSPKSGLKFTP